MADWVPFCCFMFRFMLILSMIIVTNQPDLPMFLWAPLMAMLTNAMLSELYGVLAAPLINVYIVADRVEENDVRRNYEPRGEYGPRRRYQARRYYDDDDDDELGDENDILRAYAYQDDHHLN